MTFLSKFSGMAMPAVSIPLWDACLGERDQLAFTTKVISSVTIDYFGQLDVVLNNPGYAHIGAIEEATREDVLRQFNINLLAVQSVIQHTLPHFRARKNGFYLNISSIAGLSCSTGFGIYGASKAALNLLSDLLGDEVKDFGVKVTTVLPGPFDTNFRESLQFSENTIDIYSNLRKVAPPGSPAVVRGSPETAAKIFIQLANHPNPPKRIFLGSNSTARAVASTQASLAEIQKWKVIGENTDSS
jgi:NAD(P)-dependent dehydrogenase (short-subunit alcohol dehydrogenase family)